MPLIVFKEFFVQERRMDLVIKHQENKRSGEKKNIYIFFADQKYTED